MRHIHAGMLCLSMLRYVHWVLPHADLLSNIIIIIILLLANNIKLLSIKIYEAAVSLKNSIYRAA